MNNERSCNWNLILYPEEDKSHELALKYIDKNFNCAYITHDKDINSDGTIKKPHTHVVIHFKSQRWRNSIAIELGIFPNYLERCRHLEKSLKYLIHYDDSDKFQYDLSLVHGKLKNNLLELLEFSDMSESEKFLELVNFIDNYPHKLTLHDFLVYVCSTSLFSVYRRSAMTFTNLIREHNYQFYDEK